MPAHVINVDQASAWDGDEGDYWIRHEENYNATVHRHWARLREAARISAHECVLDIGCGCGESTRGAARDAARGAVLGVDLSARMIERARERSRAEGLTNVRFAQADAQVHPFGTENFDIAISRFGVMFFSEPVAAFRNVARSLRPAGRIALLAWRELRYNEWVKAIRMALAAGRKLPEPPAGAPGPFGLAVPDSVRCILADAGLSDVTLDEVNESMCFGADTDDAYNFVSGFPLTRGLLSELDDVAKGRALAQLRAMLDARRTTAGVVLSSSAWIISGRRN